MLVQPYLFFDGRCEQAVEFYQQALGAKLEMLMRYKDAPEKPPEGMVAPGSDNKILHCSFRIGETEIMASDSCDGSAPKFDGFTLSITVESAADAERLFRALSEGGKVTMPLGRTFFSPCFGMASDRFGVHWMVIVPQPM